MQSEVLKAEEKLYEYETQYLQADYCNCGSVLRGFEGYLSSKDALRKRVRPFKEEDRLFSLSSTSSPATFELERLAQEAALFDHAPLTGGKGLIPSKAPPKKGFSTLSARPECTFESANGMQSCQTLLPSLVLHHVHHSVSASQFSSAVEHKRGLCTYIASPSEFCNKAASA